MNKKYILSGGLILAMILVWSGFKRNYNEPTSGGEVEGLERQTLTDKVDNRKIELLSSKDANDWEKLVDAEIKKCDTWTLTNVTQENIIDKLNEKLKSGKCI